MGVAVGPGRGSAAGSAVAYSLRITDIDPIKYDLLFERFLNPDRISMPDIDIDFDEDGRDKVLQWVVEKYGERRVAHIITFGTMAAKMAIRDVARIEKLPLAEADRLAKMVPEKPGITLKKAYDESPELADALKNGSREVKQVLQFAETLEGSVRHTGIHACGIIIGRNDLEEHIPLCTSKDAELMVSQFDGKHIEDVGMLKMDFLGLKTLSIIKDAVENIKLSKGVDVDIENVVLDDADTYALYARGETTGLFQFESAGMKKYLKELKPNKFEDLIAMNALYRPGPMEYIPSFINRKHGKETIHYDLPEMEEYLKESYGITVYQEQVMLLSRKLAGFTRGQADSLRKAMGKKNIELMNKLKVKFDEGCNKNGFNTKVTDKIWNDWKAFAQYAFNKSHSTCYAYVSYQTAYLKAHYPAEFMAAVLSRNINDIKKITIFMDECRKMGIQVLGPDVNESHYKFTVNKDGNIRFGLGAVKGVGEGAVRDIIQERKINGVFKDIYNFVERINLQSVNKKNMEALATAGAFDNLSDMARSDYFSPDEKGVAFVESLMRYGSQMQNEKNNAQQTLFGGVSSDDIRRPVSTRTDQWSTLAMLNKEKELIGIYLSAHPLDNYKLEINHFCNMQLSQLQDLREVNGKDFMVAGIVTAVRHSFTKNNKPFGSVTIEDYSDAYTFMFFGNDYMNFKNFMTVGFSLLLKGSVQPRFGNLENLEAKVNNIHLLSEVKDAMIKNIKITIPSRNITNELIEEMKGIINGEEGKVTLKFKIFDEEEKMGIEMFSRSKKVNLSSNFINFLERVEDIEYKVS
jgi:DNA polymerase III subunit alpha